MNRHLCICVGLPLLLAIVLVPAIQVGTALSQDVQIGEVIEDIKRSWKYLAFAATPYFAQALIILGAWKKRVPGRSYALLIGGLLGALPIMAWDYFLYFNGQYGQVRMRSTSALLLVIGPIAGFALMLVGMGVVLMLWSLGSSFAENRRQTQGNGPMQD